MVGLFTLFALCRWDGRVPILRQRSAKHGQPDSPVELHWRSVERKCRTAVRGGERSADPSSPSR